MSIDKNRPTHDLLCLFRKITRPSLSGIHAIFVMPEISCRASTLFSTGTYNPLKKAGSISMIEPARKLWRAEAPHYILLSPIAYCP
jgi:hypothetical protein